VKQSVGYLIMGLLLLCPLGWEAMLMVQLWEKAIAAFFVFVSEPIYVTVYFRDHRESLHGIKDCFNGWLLWKIMLTVYFLNSKSSSIRSPDCASPRELIATYGTGQLHITGNIGTSELINNQASHAQLNHIQAKYQISHTWIQTRLRS
jgi:hypothetical protein